MHVQYQHGMGHHQKVGFWMHIMATKVGNMQVFATILRKSLRCSLLLDGHFMGKVNYKDTR